MAGYLGEVMDVGGGFDIASLSTALLCLGALGLVVLLREKPSNDDDDSSPGGGLMQPVA
jgi:hypothetical protein